MEAEGRPAGGGRRAAGRGGEEAGSSGRRAALPALQLVWRGRLQADALAPLRGCRSSSPESVDAPAGRQGPSGSGARGLCPPGSCAQRWVAQAGGAATPDTTSPKSSPDVGVQAWWEEGGLGGAADLGSPQKDRGL